MSAAVRTPPPPLARLAFFEGAELLHGDLRDAVGHEARLLGLHVLAAHGTWGIALGLTPSIDPGGTIVTVAAGAAFTRRGEVLALPTVSLPGPAAATPGVVLPAFDLVLAARAAAPGGCVRTVACEGVELVAPHAELRWELAHTVGDATILGEGVRLGDDVPIARFVRRADGTLAGPDGSERRVVRGLVRPHVAFGRLAGADAVWSDGAADIWTRVDTSAAGFSAAPVYAATLGGTPPPPTLLGPWLHLENVTRRGFDAHLVAGSSPPKTTAAVRELLHDFALGATIAWKGVESTRGCPPLLLAPLAPGGTP